MQNLETIISEVEATGFVKNIQAIAIADTCSGCNFLVGELSHNDEKCFLKYYPSLYTPSAKIEKNYTLQLAQLLEKEKVPTLAAIPIYHELSLSNGAIILVMKYVDGVPLSTLIREKQKLSNEQTQLVRTAIFDLANVLTKANFVHRDICPKNLMLVEQKLVLFDFQTATKLDGPQFHNPPIRLIRSSFGIGAGYTPKRGLWNDIFSLAKTYEELAPILSLAPSVLQADVTHLYDLAKTIPTIQAHYTVDDEWKKANKKAYYKLLLRPNWTRKPSSRQKNNGVLSILKQLFRAAPGELIPPRG